MKINTSLIKDILNIDTTFDFNSRIKNRDDIIEIKPCHIIGTLRYETNEILISDLSVSCSLVLASSRSLKPVDYNLNFNLDLIFGNSKDADFVLTNVIDLDDIIFGHILSEKPPTIYLEDEFEETINKTKKVNPAFKELADWHK